MTTVVDATNKASMVQMANRAGLRNCKYVLFRRPQRRPRYDGAAPLVTAGAAAGPATNRWIIGRSASTESHRSFVSLR